MAVGTNIIWANQPVPVSTETVGNESGPLMLTCFTAPKGPEDLRIVSSDFESLYGSNFSFAQYGQPLIQARRIVNSGGRLLCRRLVHENATYGNIIIGATVEPVSGEETQKKDENGKLVYSKDGVEYSAGSPELVLEKDETTGEDKTPEESGYTPVMVSGVIGAKITYHATSKNGAKIVKDIEDVLNTFNPETGLMTIETEDGTMEMYPLFAISDNGRGKTIKNVRIDFKSTASAANRHAIYTMTDVENAVDVSSVNFTLNPDIIINNKSYAISKNIHPQFICNFSEEGFDKMMDKVAEYSPLSKDELKTHDILFGKTYRGGELNGVVVDAENSVDFACATGFKLFNGTDAGIDEDGNPVEIDLRFGSKEYNRLTAKFFEPEEGTEAEDIYNTDVYKIDACVDANFDFNTKAKIVELAEFRKDFFYFRDLGLGDTDPDNGIYLGSGLRSFTDIATKATDANIIESKFAGNYHTSYEVHDPYTQKPIHVTCLYSLVDSIISHFTTGRHLLFAGYSINDYIEGSIDFIPKKTPKCDQKELLESIKVNSISFISLTNFMLETMFTSTPVDGQLNYIQNVLAVEHVIKDIRTYCPAHRSDFSGSDDFDEYATSIYENVLVHHVTKFADLEFVYNSDDEISNGEFIGALTFSFNRHIQSETFNIYAQD